MALEGSARGQGGGGIQAPPWLEDSGQGGRGSAFLLHSHLNLHLLAVTSSLQFLSLRWAFLETLPFSVEKLISEKVGSLVSVPQQGGG